MAKKNGAQTVERVAGRHVIVSKGVGKTNIDELKWLTETVLDETKAWKKILDIHADLRTCWPSGMGC